MKIKKNKIRLFSFFFFLSKGKSGYFYLGIGISRNTIVRLCKKNIKCERKRIKDRGMNKDDTWRVKITRWKTTEGVVSTRGSQLKNVFLSSLSYLSFCSQPNRQILWARSLNSSHSHSPTFFITDIYILEVVVCCTSFNVSFMWHYKNWIITLN